MTATTSASVPSNLAQYAIENTLGVGGMATVYRARDHRLERDVALKVMHPHLRGAREARQRFAREARTVARLRHPGIIAIFDYSGEDSSDSYIATELLTGPTLKDYIDAAAPLPIEVAVAFTLAVAEALAAAHAQGVIHRDIKPENILLHERREVKLSDFGIAQLAGGQTLTATGQILGSPGHMAPEHLRGADCDARSDLFSLGTVLYHLCTGQLPFDGSNPHQILTRVIEGDYIDPLRLRPDIGSGLQRVIQQLLAPSPTERYASATALIADLQAFLQQSGVDDGAALLRAYLQDPAREGPRLRQQSIRHLLAGAAEAAKTGRHGLVLALCDRVLALQEGHPEALQLVRRVSQRRWRHRALRLSLSGVVLLAAVGGAGLWWWQQHSSALSTATRQAAAPPPDKPTPRPTPPSRTQPGAAASTQTGTDVAPRPAARAPRPTGTGQTTSRAATAGSGTAKPPVARHPAASAAQAAGKRLVLFQPEPQNVRIGVDQMRPRAFGPDFRSVALAPGTHSFRVEGAENCCIDEHFTVEIPAGATPYVLRKRLRFRPAGLYVVAGAAGSVRVLGAGVRGRTRSIIWVPMKRSLEQVYEFRVQAPGYLPASQSARLRAGRVEEVPVQLEPAGVGGAP